MASSSIVPFLMILLGPPEPTRTAEDAAEAAAPPPGEADADADATSADAPLEAEAPADARAGASTPEAVARPFEAPSPTAVVPPTTPPVEPIPPPPARPIRWRLDLAPGIGATIVKDLGFRAYSWNRTLLDVDGSILFDFRLAKSRFFVGGGVAYSFARRIGDPYEGALYPAMRLHEPRLLGRASFMAIEGVDVFARVGVGPSIARQDFESSYGDWDDYESYGYNWSELHTTVLPRLDGQAGLSLYLPKHLLPRRQASRITAGLELALGYVWRGKLAVEPTLDRDDDAIRVTPSHWGELQLHGLAWAARLFVRVM